MTHKNYHDLRQRIGGIQELYHLFSENHSHCLGREGGPKYKKCAFLLR